MSSIQKISNLRGTSYRVHIRKRGLKTITKTFPTKKLASQFALKVEGDRRLQLAFGGRSSKMLFSELVDSYLVNEYRGSRPKEERRKLNYWVGQFGQKELIYITRRDISSALNSLPKHLANATINRYKAAVSVVFSYACREFDLIDNPVINIRSLPENNTRVRFLSEVERKRLLDACKQSQWQKLYILVLLAITTGARKGELMNLKWSDLDYTRKTAYVKTSKNGEPKILLLTDSVIKELQQFDADDDSLIFSSTVKPDKPYCFTKPWYQALQDADVRNFTFHCLRHSCASYLAMNGASLLEIADVLGHKQIQMTKRYAHLCIEHKSSLINRVMGDM